MFKSLGLHCGYDAYLCQYFHWKRIVSINENVLLWALNSLGLQYALVVNNNNFNGFVMCLIGYSYSLSIQMFPCFDFLSVNKISSWRKCRDGDVCELMCWVNKQTQFQIDDIKSTILLQKCCLLLEIFPVNTMWQITYLKLIIW